MQNLSQTPALGIIAASCFAGLVVAKAIHLVIVTPEEEFAEEKTKNVPVRPRPFRNAVRFLSTFTRPVAACTAAVAVVSNPLLFYNSGIFPPLRSDYTASSIIKALPTLFVSTLSEAYAYGALAQRALAVMGASAVGGLNGQTVSEGNLISALDFGSLLSSNSTPAFITEFIASYNNRAGALPPAAREQIAAILAKASALTGGLRDISLEELLNVHQLIVAQDARVSLTSRILGAFTITNILYVVSILGMTALAGPVLFEIGRQLGLLNLINVLWECLIFLYRRVLVPLYHKSTPIIETACYYATVYAFVESSRYAAINEVLNGWSVRCFDGRLHVLAQLDVQFVFEEICQATS